MGRDGKVPASGPKHGLDIEFVAHAACPDGLQSLPTLTPVAAGPKAVAGVRRLSKILDLHALRMAGERNGNQVLLSAMSTRAIANAQNREAACDLGNEADEVEVV